MKPFFLVLLFICTHFGMSAQPLSVCNKEQTKKIIALIKATKTDDSLMFYPQLYNGLDDSSFTIIKNFGAKPIRYFRDFDYSKRILDFLEFYDNDGFGVFLLKGEGDDRYIYAITNCTDSSCEEIVMSTPNERFFLNPIFNSIKSTDNITLFNISMISEWFIKSGEQLYVIDGDRLVDADTFMKCKYPLDVLKRRYK